MKNKLSDAEFWAFAKNLGSQYTNCNRQIRSEVVLSALKAAEEITNSERMEWTIKLLDYLQVMAGQKLNGAQEAGQICGACLVLGCWRVPESVPVISLFLKKNDGITPYAAIDSLYLITGKWSPS